MNDKYLKARSLEYFSRCTFSQKPDNFVEVLNFCMRLHKLRSQLRGSFFIWFHFGSSYMIYFIYIYHIHLFHGNIWTHNWPAPNSSGFIAQLVWASHRYRVSQSSFLYFISLYFSTIELVKQIIETNCVSQSSSLFSYLCHLLTRIFDFVYSRAKGARAGVYFPATYFSYFIARIAWTPSLYFVDITKSSAGWEHKHVYFDLLTYLL